MAVIFSPDVIEVAVIGTLGGRQHVNVVHLRNDEAGGNDESKARDLLNNWQDHMLKLQTNSYQLVRAEWRSIDRDDNNVGTLMPDPAKAVAGTNAAEGAPPNVALLIHKVTQNRPRGRRDGRIFLSGVPEAQIANNGGLEAPWLASRQADLDAFVSGVNDAGWAGNSGSGLVVLETTPDSRVPGTHEVDLTSRAVTSLVLDPKVATQRDRLR